MSSKPISAAAAKGSCRPHVWWGSTVLEVLPLSVASFTVLSGAYELLVSLYPVFNWIAPSHHLQPVVWYSTRLVFVNRQPECLKLLAGCCGRFAWHGPQPEDADYTSISSPEFHCSFASFGHLLRKVGRVRQIRMVWLSLVRPEGRCKTGATWGSVVWAVGYLSCWLSLLSLSFPWQYALLHVYAKKNPGLRRWCTLVANPPAELHLRMPCRCNVDQLWREDADIFS